MRRDLDTRASVGTYLCIAATTSLWYSYFQIPFYHNSNILCRYSCQEITSTGNELKKFNPYTQQGSKSYKYGEGRKKYMQEENFKLIITAAATAAW